MSENDLERLRQILPAFYVLASGDWMRTRNYIHERFDNEEVWVGVLDDNGLSSEDFDIYENWWNSPDGFAVVQRLKEQFIDSILQVTSPNTNEEFEDFLRNYANWDDFIRELSDCTLADADATNGPLSYFAEYAIQQALCNSVVSSSEEFDQDLIIESMESWLKSCYDESRSILLSVYDEIAKVGVLK
jgi:AcrR family transcriptional regulator